MKGRQTLNAVIVMALVSACGIIGMLLVNGALEWLLLAVASLPLGVGLWRWRAQARATGSR